MQVSWLDRQIARVFPTMGMKRLRSRFAFEMLQDTLNQQGPQNKYEGASRTRRTEGWSTQSTSANAEVALGISMLRQRSHDLVRNNPHASRAISVLSSHTTGSGIIPQTKGRTKRQQKNIEAILKDFYDTEAVDADGRHDLYGLQRLVMRSVPEGGSVFIRRRRRRPTDSLPLLYQVQVLEGDYLDRLKEGVSEAGNRIRRGIEYDKLGRRVAYWLFPEHPGDTQYIFGSTGNQSRRVPASEVLHVYRMDRPGQMDGVPWTAPIIIQLRDFDEYQDAQLLRQKIAACFAAFVYDSDFGVPGATPTQAASTDPLVDKIEPAMIELLPGGKRVEFANPPSVEGHADFSRITLHTIGAGMDIPYDLLTTDQSQVNFASGRLGRLAFYQNVDEWRSTMFIPQMCRGLDRWTLEAAGISGVDTRDARFVWSPPRRQMVNPEKEVPAMRDAVRSGQITLFEQIRQSGQDPEDFLAEYAESLRALDEAEIVLDSDPRKTSRAGQAQENGSDPEPPDPAEGN